MSLIEAIFLGILQGLTEFLPVSSSGHIELFKVIFDTHIEEGLFFTLILHLATALSTVFVLKKDIFGLFQNMFKKGDGSSMPYVIKILISMIPAVLVGFFLEDEIDAFFSGNLGLVGVCLLITGVILFYSDRMRYEGSEITNKDAFGIGLIQAIAILPGISRSGSTIAGAVLMGKDRAKATAFSFIIVLPLIVGASLKKLIDYRGSEITEAVPDMASLGVSFVFAFVVGVFACRWMVSLVRKSRLKWFAFYCWAVGITSIIVSFIY